MVKLLEPEPSAIVKPRRAEPVAIVADIEVVYPYAGDETCELCPNPLSRYNPHVICFSCVEKLRREIAVSGGRALHAILDRRRVRNRRCPSRKNVNAALLNQAGGPATGRGRHHPQNGHN